MFSNGVNVNAATNSIKKDREIADRIISSKKVDCEAYTNAMNEINNAKVADATMWYFATKKRLCVTVDQFAELINRYYKMGNTPSFMMDYILRFASDSHSAGKFGVESGMSLFLMSVAWSDKYDSGRYSLTNDQKIKLAHVLGNIFGTNVDMVKEYANYVWGAADFFSDGSSKKTKKGSKPFDYEWQRFFSRYKKVITEKNHLRNIKKTIAKSTEVSGYADVMNLLNLAKKTGKSLPSEKNRELVNDAISVASGFSVIGGRAQDKNYIKKYSEAHNSDIALFVLFRKLAGAGSRYAKIPYDMINEDEFFDPNLLWQSAKSLSRVIFNNKEDDYKYEIYDVLSKPVGMRNSHLSEQNFLCGITALFFNNHIKLSINRLENASRYERHDRVKMQYWLGYAYKMLAEKKHFSLHVDDDSENEVRELMRKSSLAYSKSSQNPFVLYGQLSLEEVNDRPYEKVCDLLAEKNKEFESCELNDESTSFEIELGRLVWEYNNVWFANDIFEQYLMNQYIIGAYEITDMQNAQSAQSMQNAEDVQNIQGFQGAQGGSANSAICQFKNISDIMNGRFAYYFGDVAIKIGNPVVKMSFPVLDDARNYPIIHAIVKKESKFSTSAVSGKGAHGLMQVREPTAIGVAKALKIKYSRQKMLTNQSYNLKIGSYYIRQLTKRYGNVPLALAAYNSGPTRANRWVSQFDRPIKTKEDYMAWIELIPYRETKAYVVDVLGYKFVYDSMLACGMK